MIWETKDFFIQKISTENIEEPRFQYFEDICKDKKVLHIGCADDMFFSPTQNLHINLSTKCKELHGLDISLDGIKKLKEHFNGKYFTSIKDCDKEYDIILIPEVIEHIDNLKIFLDDVFSLNYKQMIITAPNIMHYSKEMIQEENAFTEIIHPDHKYWFSPYTMYNITKSYIKENYEHKILLLEKGSMICAYIRKK